MGLRYGWDVQKRKHKQKLTAEGAETDCGDRRETCMGDIVSQSGCATWGLQKPSFRFAPVENNPTRIFGTRMFWESGLSVELLVVQIDIPRVCEEADRDRAQVNLVA